MVAEEPRALFLPGSQSLGPTCGASGGGDREGQTRSRAKPAHSPMRGTLVFAQFSFT